MHDLKPKVCSVEDVSPSVDNTTLPVSFNSSARNLFLLASTGDIVGNFFKTIDQPTLSSPGRKLSLNYLNLLLGKVIPEEGLFLKFIFG